MTRYRWKVERVDGATVRVGAWHPTRDGAGDAAIRQGLAWRDPDTGQLYTDPLTSIEEAASGGGTK